MADDAVDRFEVLMGKVNMIRSENVEIYMDMLRRRLKSWMTKQWTDAYDYYSLCHMLIRWKNSFTPEGFVVLTFMSAFFLATRSLGISDGFLAWISGVFPLCLAPS